MVEAMLNLLRRPLAAILQSLFDGPESGQLELQIAIITQMPVAQVHREVNALAQLGVVTHEDSAYGNLIRLNPGSPLLTTLRISPNVRRGGADLVERLPMPGSDVNVAYLWEGSPDEPPLVIATMDDEHTDEELELLKDRLFRAIEPLLPTEPLVRVYRWIDYLSAFNAGDDKLIEVWQAGRQLAGRDPLCAEAVVSALRKAIDPIRRSGA
ncbi:hypothetical protein [Microbacterium sp. J1-1]|uniref:hypothetical protein n=1 Tax=Microbacterium sp. J1-1 TaxID=2992441 RepID=UPI0021156F13|nr:hypothetical protein [Microbacterium sp. J1-1]UUE22502.1 hypothetical protein LRQ07_18435 [Microbacterium sp. J1-1]